MKIEIRALNERRCRAGRCFTPVPEYFDEDAFSPEEWKAIEDDLLLAARRVEDDEIEPRPVLEGAQAEAALVEAAIRTLTAGQFDGMGLPRMPDLRAVLTASSPDFAARFDMATRDRVFAGMTKNSFVAPVAADASPGSSDAGGHDDLIEQAIRAFGPEDFTKGGEPRIERLREAVQKLANPDGGESGVVIGPADRDRVFKAMTEAEFEVPKGAAST